MGVVTQIAPKVLVGILADRPAAGGVDQGTLFHSTDTLECFVLVIPPLTQVRRWDLLLVPAPPATPPLAQVLLAGNTSGARDILMAPAQALDVDTAAAVLKIATSLAGALALGSEPAGLATFQVFINQNGATLHGSGSGVQYATTVASRAQYRANQYGDHTGVPGISAFKSRGGTVGSLKGVVDGDVIFRDTAVGVCGDDASIPLSGMISIQVPAGGSVPGQNWIATEFEVQLVPLEGPINGRKQVFKITSQGIPCLRETVNRAAGVAVLGAGGTVVVPNTSVKATTRFTLTPQDGGPAAVGVISQVARVVGTSFSIASAAGGADAGVQVYYQLWEQTAP